MRILTLHEVCITDPKVSKEIKIVDTGIEYFKSFDNGSQIMTRGNAWVHVTETPEQIIEMLETAQPKYKRVDLDEMKYDPDEALGNEGWWGNNRAIDGIKSKYGDLYVQVKE